SLPYLSGQRSCMAKTRSSSVRNTTMSSAGIRTTREPRRGMSSSVPTRVQRDCRVMICSLVALGGGAAWTAKRGSSGAVARSRSFHHRQRTKLMTFGARRALRPWVLLHMALGFHETIAQQTPAAGIAQSVAHICDPDAFNPWRGAFQIARFLSIKLHERGAVFQHLGFGRDFRQQVGHSDGNASVAADMQVPATFGGDDAEILDRRL